MMNDHAEVHKLARAVSKHLGGWAYDEKSSLDADGEPCWFAVLSSYTASEGSLHFSTSTAHLAQRGKVHVSGIYPRLRSGHSTPKDAPSPINISVDRGPEVIAREVSRRLLPQYVEALAVAVKERNDETDYFALRDSHAHRMAEALGVEVWRNKWDSHAKPEVLAYLGDEENADTRLDVDVKDFGGDSATMTIRGPFAALLELAGILRPMTKV